MSATRILAFVAGGLAILSFFKPDWHVLIGVGVLLLAVGLFVESK